MDKADAFARALGDVISAIETRQAEEKTPRTFIPFGTETERVLQGMLTENTGVHILDSGGAFGRHWQRNRSGEFLREPKVQVEINTWGDGQKEVLLYKSVYHTLREVLEYSPEWDRKFHLWARLFAPREWTWLTVMEEWGERIAERYGWEWVGIENTYNFCAPLTQDLQYGMLDTGGDGDLVILQIHNGADIRGGYTKPRVFTCDLCWFLREVREVELSCPECGVFLVWYGDGWAVVGSDGIYQYSGLDFPEEEFDLVEGVGIVHRRDGGILEA